MSDATAGEVSGALKIQVVVEDRRVVCFLAGELDSSTAALLRPVINDWVGKPQDLVIDVSEVSFVDSSGLGVLVGALRRFQATGHGLSLRAPNESLRRVLEITGLKGAFPIE